MASQNAHLFSDFKRASTKGAMALGGVFDAAVTHVAVGGYHLSDFVAVGVFPTFPEGPAGSAPGPSDDPVICPGCGQWISDSQSSDDCPHCGSVKK